MEEYFKFKREKKAGAAAKLPFQALFVAAYRSLISDSDHCMAYHKRGCAAGRAKERGREGDEGRRICAPGTFFIRLYFD